MPFTHAIFLFYFLPLALIVMRVSTLGKAGVFSNRARLALFGLTILFYGCKNPWWLAPFFLCIGFDFTWASLLKRAQSPGWRKCWVSLSVIQNLSLLAIFKYWSVLPVVFGQRYGGAFVSVMSGNGWLVLPPGISFYTFESLSFVIDVYRKDVDPPTSPLEFFAFIGMFPRFIAGPIVRYKEMRGQFEKYRGMDLQSGLFLFLIGLFLKCAFADSFGLFTHYAFGRPEGVEWLSAWVGSISYAMQIYFDFSGYSLMAIGLGRCLGFQFPSNFNKPYTAWSITEFWHRWHMTLSRWLRDYLYIPLGGSRHGKLRTYLNLFLTMLIGGVWHGAGLTFVVWGAWHGALLCLERATGLDSKLPRALGRLYTFLVVLIGWVFFKAQSFTEAFMVLRAMSWPHAHWLDFNPEALRIFPLASAFCLMGLIYAFIIEPRIDLAALEKIEVVSLQQQMAAMACFVISLLFAFSSLTIPFLYFQF